MLHLANAQLHTLAEGANNYNDFVVALLGYLAIFSVLTVIYVVCLVIGKITSSSASKPKLKNVSEKETVSEAKPLSEFADRRAVIAAISAAIAEDMGEDISGIRITSIKKIR